MAIMEKSYKQNTVIVWNLVGDIVEMRKGKIKRYDADSMTVGTEMYGINTEYEFRVERSPPGTTVTVETKGDSEDDRRRVELMFSTLENLLGAFERLPDT